MLFVIRILRHNTSLGYNFDYCNSIYRVKIQRKGCFRVQNWSSKSDKSAMFLPAFFVVQLVFASFISVKADVSNVCEDALKRSTNLCKRWKQEELCGESNVRALCADSCNLCQDEENKNENDSPNKYLGCFHDGVQSELKLMSHRFPITVRSCVGTCRMENFKYAGLRNGKYCMCGNDYGSYGEVLKRGGCSKRCGGREPCGGSMKNAMYRAEFDKQSKRNNYEDIEELVFGKKRKTLLSRRRLHKKSHAKLSIPKTRSWNFDSWLRKYEEQKEQDSF